MFDSIRPFHDDEVAHVLRRLVTDRQLLDLLARYRFASVYRTFPFLVRFLLRNYLRWQIQDIDSVTQFQKQITARFMEYTIRNSVTKFSYSGGEHISSQNGGILLSNHRDIVMDSAFVSYSLYKQGKNTPRIAVGDNLLAIPFAHDLMRLNKSFLVLRSETSLRKKLQELQLLSRYIHHSVTVEKQFIWLAQSEGRTKDSLDRTDTSVLKMLYLSDRKKKLSEHFDDLRMYPVSISYEYDPCDMLKARELYSRSMNDEYTKMPDEDMNSVITGLTGFKGRVHITFSPTANPHAVDNETALASLIDRQIIQGYTFFPSNLTALRLLAEKGDNSQYQQAFTWFARTRKKDDFSDDILLERVKACPSELQPFLLSIYANTCLSRWQGDCQ